MTHRLSSSWFGAKVIARVFPQRLCVETLKLELAHLKEPLKIVQISDIHYDDPPYRVGDLFLQQVIDRVNSLQPDIIVITGDLVQMKPEPIHALLSNHLSKLKAKVGIYAILGNHDYKTTHGPETIMNALKDSNITLLHNQTVYPLGDEPGQLQLIGLGDYGRKSARDLERFNIDLVLSGHTHGGQICFPNGTPMLKMIDRLVLTLPKALGQIRYPGKKVVKNWDWSRGLHKLSEDVRPERPMHLYVNRGLATHPPLRLFCDPEITVIDLIPKYY
eukprot:gene12383-14529_t